METRQKQRPVFVDALGTEWTVRITTPDVIDFCDDTGLTVAQVMGGADGGLPVSALIRAVWYGVKAEAAPLGVTRDEFYRERLTLAKVPEALQAMSAALAISLPDVFGGGAGADTPAPFSEPSSGATSSPSAPPPESAPASG